MKYWTKIFKLNYNQIKLVKLSRTGAQKSYFNEISVNQDCDNDSEMNYNYKYRTLSK